MPLDSTALVSPWTRRFVLASMESPSSTTSDWSPAGRNEGDSYICGCPVDGMRGWSDQRAEWNDLDSGRFELSPE